MICVEKPTLFKENCFVFSSSFLDSSNFFQGHIRAIHICGFSRKLVLNSILHYSSERGNLADLFICTNTTGQVNIDIAAAKAKCTKCFENTRNMASTLYTGKRRNQVVETPAWFYEELDQIFRFDFDPCPVTPNLDAMFCNWGKMNFVNPPFSQWQGFIFRCIELKTRAVLLLPITPKLIGILSTIASHVHSLIILRQGLVFKGYDSKFPYPLCLLLLWEKQNVNDEVMRLAFWDPLHSKKRKITSSRECKEIPFSLIHSFVRL